MDAHLRGDRRALAKLYEEAAKRREAAGEHDAAAFLMTQSYVFALEAGLKDSGRLKEWLIEKGRESET